jgi:hypothetical protein
MHCRRDHGWIALATVGTLSFVALSGCSKEEPPPFPDHLEGYLTESPNQGFKLYVEAANTAERDAPELIGRVNWTPDRKRAAIQAAARAIALLDSAHQTEFEFVYAPTSPLTPHAERRGWRFIGRTLVWRIEDALIAKDYKAAVDDFERLIIFGTNLSGGDGIDANLGYSLIREGRDLLWGAFPSLQPDLLRRTHNIVMKALTNAPGPHVTLRHDQAAMLKAVASIQEAYLAGDLQPFRKALAAPAAPAFDFLEELRNKPATEQVAYFERFAREANVEANALIRQASLSPHLWERHEDPKGSRPWFRFANNYFRNGKLFLREWAMHQAQMRLLAVDAALLARVKDRQGLPPDLSGIRDWARTDPFSGRDFVYVPQGTDYRLYSVGEDRKDDFADKKADLVPLWK